MLHVFGVQCGIIVVQYQVVTFLKLTNKFRQQFGAAVMVASYFHERYGVGRIAFKNSLVHVNSHPRQGSGYLCAAHVVLQQHAGNLVVEPVHIVRPFHRHAATHVLRQCGPHGKGQCFRQCKLMCHRHQGGVEQKAK